MMITKLTAGFFASIVAMPIIAQIPATTDVERLGKGTAQFVLAIVVVALAAAIVAIFKLHRQDAITAKEELKQEMAKSQELLKEQMEKSAKLISDNTSAMNLMANSNNQLKEAIYHLSHIIEKKLC